MAYRYSRDRDYALPVVEDHDLKDDFYRYLPTDTLFNFYMDESTSLETRLKVLHDLKEQLEDTPFTLVINLSSLRRNESCFLVKAPLGYSDEEAINHINALYFQAEKKHDVDVFDCRPVQDVFHSIHQDSYDNLWKELRGLGLRNTQED